MRFGLKSCPIKTALSRDTANQSNREMDQSADRKMSTEVTSEIHAQKKLSSRQWPSLSVGLFKGKLFLTFGILIKCFAGTIAQNTFPMAFTSDPSSNVIPGMTVNLTCSFKLVKDDFNNMLFKSGATQLYDHRSKDSFKGLQHDHYFSTDPNVDSVFWITLINSFCSESSPKTEYVCWVQNLKREFTQETVEVSYQGPSLEVIVDGRTIQNVNSTYSVILGHTRIGKDTQIRIVAKNFITAPPKMTLISDEEGTLPSKVTRNDSKVIPKDNDTLCIYGRELIATYTFLKGGEYTFEYSGPPNDVTIKVTVEDEPTTTIGTTESAPEKPTMAKNPQIVTTTQIPSTITQAPMSDDGDKSIKDDDDLDEYSGLGGGWIALIIIVVILVVIGLLCIYFFVISENKEENKKRVRDYLQISHSA